MPSPAYEQHLAGLHATLQTPDEILLSAVSEISRATVTERRRIVEGEANEVHAIRLADGLDLIVRIARNAHRVFERERWAIEACAAEGVPVPEILSIQQRDSGSGLVDICIERRIEGRLLSRSLDLPPAELHALTMEAGALLTRIHSVQPKGLGYLNGAGEGPHASFDAVIGEFLDEERAYIGLAARHGLDPVAIGAAFDAIRSAVRDASPVRTSLVHNDFYPKHILVKDGRISGIIDLGEAAAESPVMEFAKWDATIGEQLPVSWLIEGYRDPSLFDAGFDRLFPAFRLMASLCLFAWYAGEGYAQGVADAETGLLRDLARLTP